jgi:beta-lactam-binding protein with PASTA domain
MKPGRGVFRRGVVVPDVLGMTVPEAREAAQRAGLILTALDPDGPPMSMLAGPGWWVVTSQSPRPGEHARRRDALAVRAQERPDDGFGGVREPRRPRPDPISLHAEPDLAGEGR